MRPKKPKETQVKTQGRSPHKRTGSAKKALLEDLDDDSSPGNFSAPEQAVKKANELAEGRFWKYRKVIAAMRERIEALEEEKIEPDEPMETIPKVIRHLATAGIVSAETLDKMLESTVAVEMMNKDSLDEIIDDPEYWRAWIFELMLMLGLNRYARRWMLALLEAETFPRHTRRKNRSDNPDYNIPAASVSLGAFNDHENVPGEEKTAGAQLAEELRAVLLGDD